MIAKNDLIQLLKKEFATTEKVMRAYPSDQLGLKPHERSSDAKKLMSTFVFEMYLLAMYVLGEELDINKFKSYDPEHMDALIANFKKETEMVIEGIEKLADADLKKTTTFAGRDFTFDDFILMMLHDQIHHRGQLSVYIRLAGGKVPSIYGPSADDPSTNL